MRQALQEPLLRQKLGTYRAAHVPAPVGGWNARDSLADMKSTEATVLDNWFPRASEVVVRGGSANWATGMSGSVKSLVQYTKPDGTKKLYGVTNAGLYDITAGGAVGAVAKALTDGYFHTVLLTNSAGTTYLWGCNGVDKVVLFDGTTWTSLDGASTPAITGVTTTNVVWPWLFKHRIFFIEKNTLNFYFLPIDSIAGAASKFPLGNLFKLGGSLQSGTSWTLDSGDGPDDLCVMVTTEGELAIYKGTDPSSASSWSLVGVYFVGRPMGRRCFFKLGGDVGLLTENGVFMLSKLLASGSVNFDSALSNIIQPAFTAQTAAGGIATQGWEACVYPQFDALILNMMPSAAQSAQQYAMNSVTNAWCTFSGWAPLCFTVFNGVLYFGNASGNAVKAWDGTLAADLGLDIQATVRQAYNYFSAKGMLKSIKLLRMLLALGGETAVKWGVSPDFTDIVLSSFLPKAGSTSGSPWDTSPWDTSAWSPEVTRNKTWRAAAHHPGYALALWMQTNGNSGSLSWAGTDYILDGGGAL